MCWARVSRRRGDPIGFDRSTSRRGNFWRCRPPAGTMVGMEKPPASNLAPCPDCGELISKWAITCPQCGRPLGNGNDVNEARAVVRLEASMLGWIVTIVGAVGLLPSLLGQIGPEPLNPVWTLLCLGLVIVGAIPRVAYLGKVPTFTQPPTKPAERWDSGR